jgi:hypothetical protein
LLKAKGFSIYRLFYGVDMENAKHRVIISTPDEIYRLLDSTGICELPDSKSIYPFVPYREIKKAIFDDPLDEMPLLINTPLLSTIASWRLKIAK